MRPAAFVVLIAAAASVASAACGKGDKSTAGGVGSGSAAAPAAAGGSGGSAGAGNFDQLTVTVDGAPVRMQRAFIKRVSPDQWRLLVGDLEGSCSELLSGVTNRKPGGTSFVASIARRIHPDGSDTIDVTDFWSAGHPTDSATSTAAISGNADRDRQTFVTLAKITDVDKTRKLEVSGSFNALGCGDQALPDVGLPKAKHPATATITVAGKRLPVLSAIRMHDAILLSTGPRDCTPPTVQAQVTLEHAGARWDLAGTWLAQPVSSTDAASGSDDHALKLAVGAIGRSADGPTVALELAGAGKLGDYPVVLDGAIEALDCPPSR